MEYLYIAMFLQEVGKELNETNIKKVFAALDLEADSDKVRFISCAVPILSNRNIKNSKEKTGSSAIKQLQNLENKFETLKNSIETIDNRVAKKEDTHKIIKGSNAPQNHQMESIKNTVYKENQDKESKQEEKSKSDIVTELNASKDTIHKEPARYVYGIADKGIRENLGNIGIDGAEVYTIPCRDMCIVVHDCSSEPYQSDDDEIVKNWLFTQQEVLDAVAERFGVVLPMSFDMIIEGKNTKTPEEAVKAWLEENYEKFYQKLIKLRNKREYGVQVILDTAELSKQLIETDEKLIAKKKEIDSKPQGLAYMEKEILKDMIKEKIEETSDKYFKEFYSAIRKISEDIVIGKVKKVGGNKQMIMNLSCLVDDNKVKDLGKELENIENKGGISVRFSGPWAPFSFVTPEKGGE